jgi:uncharacterized protein with ParB-like and HNH nuclease domain
METIKEWESDPYYRLELDPDFQRGHIWTEKQQTEFIEYFLSGGVSGRVIYFNKPSWQGQPIDDYDDFVCVDGLQRITAFKMFLSGEVKAFGQYRHEFGDDIRRCRAASNLRLNVNCLKTKKEVLQWYVQMNSGGTPHTKEEIEKVQRLLLKEQ